MKKQRILLTILLMAIIFTIHPQNKNDLSGWGTTDVVFTHNRWEFTGSLEYRSKENLSNTDLFSIAQYNRYTFSQFFKLSAGYEIFFTNIPNRNTVIEHRLLLQNESSIQFWKIKVDNRLSLLNDFEKIGYPGWGFRDRIRIKYLIKYVEPFTFIELYYKWKNEQISHNKNRYAIGIHIPVNTKNTVGLYYMREHYFQKVFDNNIIGLSYVLTVHI